MHRRRREEQDEEERKVQEYREIGVRLKGYPEEDVRKARQLVSSFIRAAEEVEEVICYNIFENYNAVWLSSYCPSATYALDLPDRPLRVS